MDGYGAYAEFYGSTTVKSNPAYIYVSKRPAATASTNYSSGTCFSDLYNYITVYSSNGAKIHYECIKDGDTGPYASGDVPNGGTITIAGIDGQYINVEVYLNVVGSDKVSYYYYGVDRTPVPIYEYTEYGYVIGENYAEIFIQTSSGVHYIPKDACMFGGTGYAAIDDYAEVTFRNGEVLIAVIDCTG